MFILLTLAILHGCALRSVQYAAALEMTSEVRIFTRNQISTNGISGDNLKVDCGVTNADKAVVSWWRGDTKLSEGNRTLTNDSRVSIEISHPEPFWSPVDGLTTLVIGDIRMRDTGEYTCTATPLDETKKAASHTQDVHVSYKTLFGATKYIKIAEGETLSASCKATGNPKPLIKWIVKDINLKNRELPQFNGLQNISIAQMNHTDAGWYHCLVDNGTGDPFITTAVAASVIYPPKFVDGLFGPEGNVTYARIGDKGYLTCYFAVYPPGDYAVKWFHTQPKPVNSDERTEIVDDDRHEIGNSFLQAYERISFSLRIKNIQEGDLGKYICTAKNERGFAEGEVELRKKD